MKVASLEIPEVKLIEPNVYKDERGYFFESFNDKEFREKVCNTTFVQDNESKSSYGTVRGLHWQAAPYAQSKLVRVVNGCVYDIAVDIRRGSPTFGQYCGAILSAQNHWQLFIPRGFAHGFVALTNDVVFQYKCDNFYNKSSERAIRYDSIPGWLDGQAFWPKLDGNLILSEKDKLHPTLDTISEDDLFDYNVDYYVENCF